MKAITKLSSLRPLSADEIILVAGGLEEISEEIVVTGHRYSNNVSLNDGGGGGGGWGFGGMVGFSSGGSLGSGYIGSAIQQLMNQDSDGDGTADLLDETPMPPDIVVTATPAMVSAANIAYDRAYMDYSVGSIIGLGALGGVLARGIGGIAGAIGAGGGQQALSLAEDSIIDGMADMYYLLDGADGLYDGFSENDRMYMPGTPWQNAVPYN